MRIFVLVISLLAGPAIAQTLTVELREGTGEQSKVLFAGTVDYKTNPVVVTPQGDSGRIVNREVRIPGGWAVGCTDYGENEPQGFGCWLARRPSVISLNRYDGFSWEWYDRGVGTLYEKRQGEGKVALKTQATASGHSMLSIEFLDDTIFWVKMTPKAQPDTHTHELHILKGSVLLLSPEAPQQP
jgi:hypothetical protein